MFVNFQTYHFTQMIFQLILVFERLETLQTLNEFGVLRMLLTDVLLQRMFVAVTFVAKRALGRDLLLVNTFGLIERPVLVKTRRHTISQFTGQWNSKK